MKIAGIYFDLDDTLCAYWEAGKAGLLAAFRAHPVEDQSPEQMLRHWAKAFREFSPTIKRTHWYPVYLKLGGPTRVEQMRMTLREAGVEDEELAGRLADSYAVERNRALRMFPDAAEVLEALSGRLPLGLITNGPADVQREEIATLGLEGVFDPVLIEGEMGFGKPDPRVFEIAREAMGLEPREILFVGNSYAHDIAPAIEAGWHTAWIRRPTDVPPSADGTDRGPEARPSGSPAPDLETSDLREILAMLHNDALK